MPKNQPPILEFVYATQGTVKQRMYNYSILLPLEFIQFIQQTLCLSTHTWLLKDVNISPTLPV